MCTYICVPYICLELKDIRRGIATLVIGVVDGCALVAATCGTPISALFH